MTLVELLILWWLINWVLENVVLDTLHVSTVVHLVCSTCNVISAIMFRIVHFLSHCKLKLMTDSRSQT